jgi:hypothetical protein
MMAFLSSYLILEPKSISHTVVDKLHDNREPHVEDHGCDDGIAHSSEPVLVEVGVMSLEVLGHEQTLLLQVGIAKHEQKTGVEEDADEDTVSDVFHLLRFSLAAHLVDDDDHNHTDHCVDYDNQVLNQVVHGYNFPLCLLVVFADGLAHFLSSDR